MSKDDEQQYCENIFFLDQRKQTDRGRAYQKEVKLCVALKRKKSTSTPFEPKTSIESKEETISFLLADIALVEFHDTFSPVVEWIRFKGVKEMLMQLTQIKFGGNLEQMHKQLKQERIVLEKSAKLNLDPGRCDGGNWAGDGVQVQEVLADQ